MSNQQKSYMVFGGEVTNTKTREFKNPDDIEVVGIFKDYEEAFKAWRGAAQRTVDNAEMRFYIVEVGDITKVSQEPKN